MCPSLHADDSQKLLHTVNSANGLVISLLLREVALQRKWVSITAARQTKSSMPTCIMEAFNKRPRCDAALPASLPCMQGSIPFQGTTPTTTAPFDLMLHAAAANIPSQQLTLLTMGALLKKLNSCVAPHELHDVNAKCSLVLASLVSSAKAADEQAALERAALEQQVAELQEKNRQLNEELAGYQDMAERLKEACTAACNANKADSDPSPAPWFSDPSLDLPFALPSISGGDDSAHNMSIGELLVRDLQANSFESICGRYTNNIEQHATEVEASLPELGGSAEAATIGGSSWHGGTMW